ncbi:extracellular calcium-sensing receptor [Erpetoichthys calabaricus]|uniref:extracellular calcium-sensing receptor n=1 Tax=Erpetoichthys calabaricus TaxID=27687 RepID=UPI0022345281|nr:extracellular calcium-sensing receptor [Erpetoichthys calabaricus]
MPLSTACKDFHFSLTLLLLAGSAGFQTSTICKLLGLFDLPGLESDGDIVIGGLFPVHFKESETNLSFDIRPTTTKCESFDFRAFRWVQTMIFAIEEINKNPTLLPGVTLGYKIIDTCDNIHNGLQGALKLVNGKDETSSLNHCNASNAVPAIIGLASSSPTRAIAHTIGPFGIPVVSYFATCAYLTDKKEFPTFLRTVPSDLFQVRALVQLITHFGWTWVGAIATDDDYGHYGIQSFADQAKEKGVCLSYYETIPNIYSEAKLRQIATTIKKSTAKVIIVFASEGKFYELLKEVLRENITDRQWIASEAWVTAALLTTDEFYTILGGTIGFAFRGAQISGLLEFLQRVKPSPHQKHVLTNMFWEEMFNCRLNFSGEDIAHETTKTRICTGSENLLETKSIFLDVSQLRVSYNVYKAVYAIAHGLHKLLECDNEDNLGQNISCKSVFPLRPWQVLSHLKTVNFTNRFGEKVYFDQNGEPVPLYDIINWQKDFSGAIKLVKVGSFDASALSGEETVINEEKIIWSRGQSQVPYSKCSQSCPPGTRKATQNGKPTCCFDCVSCADGEISNLTDSLECTKCAPDFWSDENRTKCVARDVEYLSFQDTMGVTLTVAAILGAFLTLTVMGIFFYFRSTPLVKANNSELSFLLLGSLELCFLCSLTFIGEPSLWSCMTRHTAFGISFVLCISCILAKSIVVLGAFKSTLPASNAMKWFGPLQQRAIIIICTLLQAFLCITWLTLSPPFPFRNTNNQGGKIILQCNAGSVLAFYLVLGYIGLISCVCFILAFLGRKLPNNFNEAKLITFSMLIFFAVWIAFIPAYESSPGKYTVAVEVFAILSSSFGLLLCIFIPKCYIILLHPEKNTKKGLIGKAVSLKKH